MLTRAKLRLITTSPEYLWKAGSHIFQQLDKKKEMSTPRLPEDFSGLPEDGDPPGHSDTSVPPAPEIAGSLALGQLRDLASVFLFVKIIVPHFS